MSVLRSLESKIAGLIEGTFSRAFRSEVRPVEIARKLAREMEDNKALSLSRTYVPNEYRVFLSTRDRERFADYEDALASELAGYLLEHARRERLVLTGRPVIEFETDDRLGLGEFGIQTGVVDLEHQQGQDRDLDELDYDEYELPDAGAPAAPPPGGTLVYSGAERLREPLSEPARSRRRTALLVVGGRRLVVPAAGASLGRSRQCDVMVDDPNVSRKHAEIRPEGGGWVLIDLGSTNGSRLNGHRVSTPEQLEPGDQLELGTTLLRFELE
jgi:FhaA, N-terminal domain/FHA domain